jgi:hypothetical protein
MIIAAAVLALSGCAAPSTGIVKIADDTYMYSKQDWMAYSGGSVKADMYKEAGEFCAKQGKKLVPIGSTSQDYAIARSSASAEIQFACK